MTEPIIDPAAKEQELASRMAQPYEFRDVMDVAAELDIPEERALTLSRSRAFNTMVRENRVRLLENRAKLEEETEGMVALAKLNRATIVLDTQNKLMRVLEKVDLSAVDMNAWKGGPLEALLRIHEAGYRSQARQPVQVNTQVNIGTKMDERDFDRLVDVVVRKKELAGGQTGPGTVHTGGDGPGQDGL